MSVSALLLLCLLVSVRCYAREVSQLARALVSCPCPCPGLCLCLCECLCDSLRVCVSVSCSLGVVLYVLLCGFPPFMPPGKASSRPIEEQITSGSFVFYSPYFDHVSAEAKDLVSRLLVLDPAYRLSAAEVLSHPWFRTASTTAIRGGVRDRLASLTGIKKFKLAGQKVQSMIRLRHAGLGGAGAGGGGGYGK